jgi:uncharacterized membrane protein
MKNKYILILVLALVALGNAIYLSYTAYQLLHTVAGVTVTSGCDINPTFSCSNVIVHPDTMIAGIPFPYLALVVYPIITLLAIWGLIRTRKVCKSEYDAKQTSETKGVCTTTNE